MKILLSTLMLFMAMKLPAQIKILKNESLYLVGKENSVELYKRKNKYTITYQDINDSNLNIYRSFSFLDLNKDADTLYELLTDGLENLPKQEILLELPDDIVGLVFAKNYGQPTVQFVHYIQKSQTNIGKSPFLNKYQLAKIFDKPIEKQPTKPRTRKKTS